ncbi:MAG TPA: YncE family protein [Thermoplasmata archaeon]|nr:YncE family protein [Thermoplasmata archaeon]
MAGYCSLRTGRAGAAVAVALLATFAFLVAAASGTVAHSLSGTPALPSPSSRDGVSVVSTVSVGSGPSAATYDGGKSEVFIGNGNSNTVSVISGSTNAVVATIGVGTNPESASYDSSSREVYIANENSNNVSVISDDMDRVIANVGVGSEPFGSVYDSYLGEVFVANFGSNNVSVISDDQHNVFANVPVGSGPGAMTFDSTKDEVFVANENSNNVSVISDLTNTVVATVAVGVAPQGADFDPTNGYVYVVNDGSNNVSVISDVTDKVVATVPVAGGPVAAAYASSPQELFVTEYDTNQVTAISTITNTVVANVSVGSGPDALGYDSGTNRIYVADYGADSVDVLSSTASASYVVTFTESTLPTGTNWSVTLNGTTLASVTGAIEFAEPKGVYPFTVGPVAGYRADPAASNVTVTRPNLTVPISFTPFVPGKYAVTFAESGLVAGTNWTVTVNGYARTSASDQVTFVLPNGSQTYSVDAVSGYTLGKDSGTVNVSGSAKTVPVAFDAIPSSRTYVLSFTSTGLPSGTNWSVTIGIETNYVPGTTVVFHETNGSYAYLVATVPGYRSVPSSGTVNVTGHDVDVAIAFAPDLGSATKSAPSMGLVDYGVIGVIAALVIAAGVAIWSRGRAEPPAPPPTTPPAPAPPVGAIAPANVPAIDHLPPLR